MVSHIRDNCKTNPKENNKKKTFEQLNKQKSPSE